MNCRSLSSKVEAVLWDLLALVIGFLLQRTRHGPPNLREGLFAGAGILLNYLATGRATRLDESGNGVKASQFGGIFKPFLHHRKRFFFLPLHCQVSGHAPLA